MDEGGQVRNPFKVVTTFGTTSTNQSDFIHSVITGRERVNNRLMDPFVGNYDRTKPLTFSRPLNCIANIMTVDSIRELPLEGMMVFLGPAVSSSEVKVTRFQKVKLADGSLFVNLPDYPGMIVNNGDFAGATAPSNALLMPLPLTNPQQEIRTIKAPFILLRSMEKDETPVFWEALISNFTLEKRQRYAELEDQVRAAMAFTANPIFLQTPLKSMLDALEHEVIVGFAEGMNAGMVARGASESKEFYMSVKKL